MAKGSRDITVQVLDQLLAIKRCRETALRHRIRRLERELDERRGDRTRQQGAQVELRRQWRAENQREHAVERGTVHRLRRRYAELYEREQQLSADLIRLEEQIAEHERDAADERTALKRIQRGQEKLDAVLRERK
ncbi:hypothetical protein [Cupriavidus sp. AU9028]|uniref:hypothetical protein n=1 Tax=Cupriavidus sp. AU9028 TaxID=2871157 RepID=UPI001C97C1DA|nr:hypothetical protein [Cupriavidus sp. AU9028]MBY4897879.1 hypothetical protein [Cupriavidus sp. AU9028]